MRPYLMCPLALAMFASPLQAQPVFRSGVDLVHLGVTVVGKDGQPVSGLRAEDFVIQEEGREQGIAYFTRGLDNDLETMPLHLGVLFDTSGSMEQDREFAKTAAIKFLNSLTQAVSATLGVFPSRVRIKSVLQIWSVSAARPPGRGQSYAVVNRVHNAQLWPDRPIHEHSRQP